MFAQPSQHSSSNLPRQPFSPTLPSQGAPQYHNHYPGPFRQLHAPKSPLYRPAVLRPTEQPVRPPSATPSTSPKSFHSNLSGDSKQEQIVARNPTVYINGAVDDEEDDVFDVSTIVESEDGEEGGRVTGPPRRNHWKVSRTYILQDWLDGVLQPSPHVQHH